MRDRRYVYGANCAWFGSINDVGVGGGLPCCPHCGGMLFETENRHKFFTIPPAFEADHPGYTEMMQWLEEENKLGPCRKTIQDAAELYFIRKGIRVDMGKKNSNPPRQTYAESSGSPPTSAETPPPSPS